MEHLHVIVKLFKPNYDLFLCLRYITGLQIKMEALPSHKQMFLLFHRQHFSAQIGHHQVIGEKYTNYDGIHMKVVIYSINLLVILRQIRLNTICILYFKINKFWDELMAYFPLVRHGQHRKRRTTILILLCVYSLPR
jgi:hypothetical protein